MYRLCTVGEITEIVGAIATADGIDRRVSRGGEDSCVDVIGREM